MPLPTAPTSWTVLNHGPLETLDDGLWRVAGSLPNMGLPRCGVFARHIDPTTGDPGLVVHSAVSVEDSVLQKLVDAAPPRWLIVPNAMHRLDAPAWKARFPELQVICPPAARTAVSEKVSVDATFDELADRFTPGSGVELRPLAGIDGKEWAMIIHHGDDTASLAVTDAIFNLPHQPGFGGLMMRLMGSSGGPKVTFVARTMMVSDKKALADDLRSLAAMGPRLRRIIPGHGEVIDTDAADTLRKVADALHS